MSGDNSRLTISVAQLNSYVAGRLAQDAFLRDVWVEGEIEKPSVRRGIAFFALVDPEASLECMIFAEDLDRLTSLLEHGRRVRTHGDVSLYRRTGRFRLIVHDMKPAGVGELFLRMLELQKRLAAKGLFDPDRKRDLPRFPRQIAVVTSRDGAALQDILKVAGRRNPGIGIRVYPTLVQGDRAPASIVQAINRANADPDADLLIIARGGGSAGDLVAFNDEAVVEAVAASRLPTVSAVGHETDVSLCDLAADRRAATPSAAAEIAVPDREQLMDMLRAARQTLHVSIARLLDRQRAHLQAESRALRSLAVTQKIDVVREQLRFLLRSAKVQLERLLDQRRSALRAQAARLDILNPNRILKSGYAVILREGRRVHSARNLAPGDCVELLFADGRRKARVVEETSDGRA